MTISDKRLTNRATDTVARGIPSFPTNDLRVFLAAFERLGYKPESLLAAAGLRRCTIDDPDARITCEAFGVVVGCAMQQRPIKNVGTRIAAETPFGSFPLLDYLVITSNSVGEGFKQLAQYFRVVRSPGNIEVHEDEHPILVVVSAVSSVAAEFSIALDVLHFRKETGGRFQPEWVSFAHQPEDQLEIEGILGCPIRAHASWNGLAISGDAWRQPLLRRDPILRNLLEQQANEIIARIPSEDSVAARVRRVLAKRIPRGDTRIDSVARELVTTTRTLQRRLDGEGFSYQDLVEQSRKEAAQRYLSEFSLSIAEIGYLLDYSEPSAFHRAFKRWYGLTPQAFRQAQHATKSGVTAHH
ncbi:MAG TPA: AraC family transcriptional regulator ligand-binding domain-containing protein [Terriglobales bacterium]|nr:AraC family transcriptional regulator ligand-binding domain-containing protein [Terriglobales bacterium]